MQQPHIGDVIDVYLRLQHDDQCLAVQLDGQNGGWKKELANHGLTLKGQGVSMKSV